METLSEYEHIDLCYENLSLVEFHLKNCIDYPNEVDENDIHFVCSIMDKIFFHSKCADVLLLAGAKNPQFFLILDKYYTCKFSSLLIKLCQKFPFYDEVIKHLNI